MAAPPAWNWRWLERDVGAAMTLRPYRSYTSLFVDLDREREFLLWKPEELPLYCDLARRSLRPGYLLLELTGYPLAAFSAWMQAEQPRAYRTFDVTERLNLIRSLGAGYQEPWSVSLFLGQLATFWDVNAQDELVVAARGAAGFVLTAGGQQLFDNAVVTTPWLRVEWKVKGEGIEGTRRRFWDLKAGWRWYGLPEVAPTASLTLKRQRTDKHRHDWRPGTNSLAVLDLQLPVGELADGPSRLLVEYGKVFPAWNRLVGVKVGVLYECRRVYDTENGAFGAGKESYWELIVQPLVIL